MRDDFEKGDRLGRLMRELALLQGVPRGLTTAELAERIGVCQRTVQRDLRTLGDHVKVPVYQAGSRWAVRPEYWLKPVAFSLDEAMGLLLGARLRMRHSDKADAYTASAYEKLAGTLPHPARQAMVDAAQLLTAKPGNPTFSRVMTALTRAWAERRRVVITYTRDGAFDRKVWPLFLEPALEGHALYLLAWDEVAASAKAYKVDRIAAARVLDETFEPPAGFAPHQHMAGAWSIWGSAEPVEVELVFSPAVASRVRETVWHPSQHVTELDGGRLRMTLRVGSWLEIRHWVLGWGETCEVVRPDLLRQSVATAARALAAMYGASQTVRGPEATPPVNPTELVRSRRQGQARRPRAV